MPSKKTQKTAAKMPAAKTAKTAPKETKTLVLLDAHAIIHRAYHALPDFASSKGEPTGALYGLISMLVSLIQQFNPDYIAAAFDLPKPTYRHEVYKDYKAGRKKIDDALVVQLQRARDVFTAFNIPIYDHEGFEADDMLGTIVEQMNALPEMKVVIASGDMDTLQLVSGDKVTVFTLRKGIKDTVTYNEKAVHARFGFGPEHIPDYKGLRGDASDNIIGIKGIGEKTATQLITAFGTIEEMYAALKKNEKKFQEKAGVSDRVLGLIKDGEEEALFSKTLATIRRDAPIVFVVPEKGWRDSFDIATALALCTELEFRSLAARIKAAFGVGGANGAVSAVGKAVQKGAGEVDVQAKGSKVGKKSAAAGTAANASSTTGAFDFGATQYAVVATLPEDKMKELRVMVWVLNSNLTNPTTDDILSYTNTDTLEDAYRVASEAIIKNDARKVFEEIEKPLIPVIDAMNARGVCVDVAHLKGLSTEYHKELSKLEKAIWKHAGQEFNINSPKQMGTVLFETMALGGSRQKKTAGGALSTREEELVKLRDKHPIIDEILKYRELQKLLSTYIDAIPTMVEADGRLRTTFVQTGAATGRMSSQAPNLQNIPIKTELGRAIRKAFVAEKGNVLLAVDYSQIELRIAAFMSKDEKLLDIFRNGRDVHTEVAAQVFKVPAAEVTKEMRRQAKVINFGILYGMGVNALKQNLGTDRATAQQFYNDYFSTFTTLAQYLDSVRAETERKGYTETFFGRRRYFEGIRSRIPYVKAMAERMAINAPIQGTGADILKLAMVEVHKKLASTGLASDAQLIMQIHDELVYEVSQNKIKDVTKLVMETMHSVMTLEQSEGVELIVEGSVGENYGMLQDVKN